MAAYRKTFWKSFAGIILAAGVVMILAPLAARAQCVVTATTDTGTGSGGTSGDLRYCVAQANAAASAYSITFAGSLNGQTITLTPSNGPLEITNTTVAITITGPGANLLTISGGNAVGVFQLGYGAGSPTVNISGLTIANGKAADGGGILNDGGTLTVSNSTFFANNATTNGGAISIATGATVTVSNSTISGNTAEERGGGIYSNGNLTVSNCTFSINLATNGAGIYNGGNLTVSNSTFSGNIANAFGGGIWNNGTLTVSNSIVAGNTTTGLAGDDCDSCTAGTYSLINTTSTLPAINPMLAPLGNYGGPTQTMVPLPGSPALGAGQYQSGEPVTDQRGFPRPSSGTITIGAVQGIYLLVTSAADTNDSPPGCSDTGGTPCSLRDALTIANTGANANGTDIAFALSYPNTITVDLTIGPLPAITGNLDLLGPGANQLKISGGGPSGSSSIFSVNAGNAAINGLTITGGFNSVGGGGISNDGTLAVNNCTISGNIAPVGGGILNEGNLTVSNSTISANTAPQGGGIWSTGNTLRVSNSTISGNTASDEGGGIYNLFSLTTVSNSTISGNTATDGGGIWSQDVFPTLFNSIVAGNTTSSPAGDDCYGCGTPSTSNLINTTSTSPPINPNLAGLDWYGGPTQTMLPLPGSRAICKGSPALLPAGVTTDQRGFPRLNTAYLSSTSGTCLDLGAVQTNYQSVQFTNAGSGYTALVNQDASPTPIVSVTENGQNIGGVPVSLGFSGTGTPSGLGPVYTTAGAGAEFSSLSVNAAGTDTLSATLQITPSGFTPAFSIATSTTAALVITLPPTTTTITGHAPNPSVVGQGVTVSFTVAPVSPSGNTPTGTVTVSDGSDSCTKPPSATPVSCTLIITTAGSPVTLTATYSGDSNFAGSYGTASQTVNPASTTTSITSHAPNPAMMQQPVTIQFTVAPIPPGGTPTGNVTVSDGVGDSCTAPAASGSCSIRFVAAGKKTVTASFAGDNNYNSSASAAVTQNVIGFTVSASPRPQSIRPGDTAMYQVTLTSVLGFKGNVTLSCGALPPDSGCSIVPSVLWLGPSGSVTSIVLIQTNWRTPAGTYTPTIIATYGSGIPSTGGATQSTTVTLTVK
jgi:predicted outer membrane repeat protein